MPELALKVIPNDQYTETDACELLSLFMESDSGGRVDLKPLYQNLTFVEDIYACAITGSIIIKDAVNLLNTFRVSGYEKLTVVFRTPGINQDYIKKVFDIVEISDLVKADNDRVQVYRLNFVSNAATKDKTTKISKSVKGKVSDIAKKIYSEFIGGDLTTEDTLQEQKYVIPRWSPFKTLEWLAKRAIPAKRSDETNYVFFENLDGHQFVPLSKLNSGDSIMTYYIVPKNARNDNPSKGADLSKEFSNARSVHVIKSNQKLKEQMSGAFGSTLYVHDVTTKQWGRFEYNYNDDDGKVRYVDVKKLTKSSDKYSVPSSIVHLSTKQTGLMGEDYPDTQDHPSWLQRSISSNVLMESMKLKIATAGNSLLRAGSIIEFYMQKPSAIRVEDSDWYDKVFSGRFLITTIRHIITPEGYTNIMILGKNAYTEPLPDKSTFMGIGDQQQKKSMFK